MYKDEYLFPARRILNHINGDMQEFLNQQRKQGENHGFVNYIAGNNGFTLADVFRYNDRHNEENGENNEDGSAWNFSCNYGTEGSSTKRSILKIRKKQWRNAIIMLMCAQGVPLLWQGDEMENSQNGNNNAYCQDNKTGWVNWANRRSNRGDIAFVRQMASFRKSCPLIAQKMPFRFNDYASNGIPDLSYHGESAWLTGIQPGRTCVGVLYCGDYAREKQDIYIGYNFFSGISPLALPGGDKKKKWYLVVNSADYKTPFRKEPVLCADQKKLTLSPQSICILIGK